MVYFRRELVSIRNRLLELDLEETRQNMVLSEYVRSLSVWRNFHSILFMLTSLRLREFT